MKYEEVIKELYKTGSGKFTNNYWGNKSIYIDFENYNLWLNVNKDKFFYTPTLMDMMSDDWEEIKISSSEPEQEYKLEYLSLGKALEYLQENLDAKFTRSKWKGDYILYKENMGIYKAVPDISPHKIVYLPFQPRPEDFLTNDWRLIKDEKNTQ